MDRFRNEAVLKLSALTIFFVITTSISFVFKYIKLFFKAYLSVLCNAASVSNLWQNFKTRVSSS